MEERRWSNEGRCERGSWTGGGESMRSADERRRKVRRRRRAVGRCSCRKYWRSGCWWNEEETPSASSVVKKQHSTCWFQVVQEQHFLCSGKDQPAVFFHSPLKILLQGHIMLLSMMIMQQ